MQTISKKIGVVITGGDFQGLGVLRTLAKKDIPVVMLDNDYSIARFSMYKKKFFRSPNPFDEESYINFLIDLVKQQEIQGWILIPNSDSAVCLLSKYKQNLHRYHY